MAIEQEIKDFKTRSKRRPFMNTALILIDIQKDYFPGGRMELAGPIEASEAASRLLTAFRERGLPIVHIQHIAAREGATFFVPSTEGINFHENVNPLPDETVIVKHYPNSFRETSLSSTLEAQKIDQIVVCGMMSHMCIDATVRAAFDKGYNCIVAHDACAARNLAFGDVAVSAEQVHAGFMAALSSLYAKVIKADEVLDLLQK